LPNSSLTVDRLDYEILDEYMSDWNKFAKDILNVRLTRKQRIALENIQLNRRVSIRSAHGCGKDYMAAVASLCQLYLNSPSKVINTAPTNRQVVDIMMSEIIRIHQNARIPLGGKVLTNKITFDRDPSWYMEGFKARDKVKEDWSGYHSPNLMIVVTEASGVEDEAFNAIEGILTGNSKLVLIFNPNRMLGEAYRSTQQANYTKMSISGLRCPNVRAKKVLIPGQIDWEWVNERITTPGWVTEISESQKKEEMHDFKWEGKWYRPSDLFLVQALGEFPREATDALIPRAWVEMAFKRWKRCKGKGEGPLRLGVDVAGMGADLGVFTYRRGNVVERFGVYSKQDHMVTVGKIKNSLIQPDDKAFVDTIGEGAGVYSRLIEQRANAESVKGSVGGKSIDDLTDLTGQRKFINLRAYLYWAIRDALDPALDGTLALPPNDSLLEDLTAVRWTVKSNGKIILCPKEEIKKAIGRSPDFGDSTSMTFMPDLGRGFRVIEMGEDIDDDYDDDDDDDYDVGLRDQDRLVRRLERDEDD
jgi:hypothetical protein